MMCMMCMMCETRVMRVRLVCVMRYEIRDMYDVCGVYDD